MSLYTMPGTAKRVWELCRDAGITMTEAGRHLSLWEGPGRCNLRIAPSLPPVAELEQAMVVLCVCLKLAALEKLLAQ